MIFFIIFQLAPFLSVSIYRKMKSDGRDAIKGDNFEILHPVSGRVTYAK